MKHFYIVLLISVSLAACSNEEPANPEDTLEAYVDSWSSQSISSMLEQTSEESQSEIGNFEWDFEERYEQEYGRLAIEDIHIFYDSRDFEEEEVDLDELEEISYPISVQMDSVVGAINYETEVNLVKQVVTDEDNEEREEWSVEWDPTHLMMAMQDPHDEIAIEREQPNRGEIFDRNGEALAKNGEIYQVSIVPERTEDLEDTVSQFAEVTGLDEERVGDLANAFPDEPSWAAQIQNISLIDERKDELLEIEGVLLDTIPGREYPYGDITGHLVGHIGDITGEELEGLEDRGYTAQSEIGKYGIEYFYEEELRGTEGLTVSIKTEDGEVRDVITHTEPEDGENIPLTIDISMQQKLADVLQEDSGSGVVTDPLSGETLALVSEPAFDSNLRYLQLSDPRAEELDTVEVLFEQRFRRAYSPGSIFKPFTAIAGIEEGTLDPEEIIVIEGEQWQPDDSWGGYLVTRVNDSETEIDLETAMKLSDNIYFAQQALELGEDSMEEWMSKMGFGESIPYEIPLGTSSIANDGLKSEILLADTGYGQGEVQVTPVHMNALYSTFLNEGQMVGPTLIVGNDSEREEREVTSSETAALVEETLIAVVEDSDGTAYRSDPGHTRLLAGKTGTAELKQDQTEEDGEQVGWYVSYDYDNADLLTTIMVQNAEDRGGSGYVVDLANEFWQKVDE
ncbi:hypothetical protein CR194_13825 [Salipaludibacillus keqinensis]|uniref:serine-type D-Ala-D-Ala carboxypeptidase n=1 Tax=Salipaludibacillus keqinensis TaxID=2045207 RepID=A0A323TCI6_9BACI|nr:penicillin-binding transpeptidase domain-containing protein [Salipaludibacillus keqinensis]PYZ92729.1 hypothetical protein CR194_13825 [Salipaludibacillus keqinensis]